MVLIAAVMIARKFSSPEPSRALPGAETQQNSAARHPSNSAPGTSQGGNTTLKPGLSEEAAEKSRAEALEKIEEASTSYDPAQLPVIRPYLTHPDPALRTAAVNGMLVLGDASAGPMLRDAAKSLSSPEEAKKMEEAANYVALPSANLKKHAERAKERKKTESLPMPQAPVDPPSEGVR